MVGHVWLPLPDIKEQKYYIYIYKYVYILKYNQLQILVLKPTAVV